MPACQSKQGETLLGGGRTMERRTVFVTTPTAHWKRQGIQQVHHGCVEEYAQPVGVEDKADADLGKEDRKAGWLFGLGCDEKSGHKYSHRERRRV